MGTRHFEAALAAALALRAAGRPALLAAPLLALGSGAAVAVGIERVRAGAHWPSDVVVGILFGTHFGTALGALGRRRQPGARRADGGRTASQ